MEILAKKSDKGLKREKNQDAIILREHPKNKKYKLLGIADGMGGKKEGEVAAQYTLKTIEKWYQKTEITLLNNNKKCINALKKTIKNINNTLIKKYGENYLGTTLTLALVNTKNTIIINIGDSRCYIRKEKKLIQITEDDSEIWHYYKNKEIKKDDLRYFCNNNLITACVGLNQEFCKIKVKIIDNTYELILLVTDGVTDVLIDRKINKIIKVSEKVEVLDNIINEAVNVKQKLKIPRRLKRKKLGEYSIPLNGKDNASGVIYIK